MTRMIRPGTHKSLKDSPKPKQLIMGETILPKKKRMKMKLIPKLKLTKMKRRRKKMTMRKRVRVMMKPRMRLKRLVYLKRNEKSLLFDSEEYQH